MDRGLVSVRLTPDGSRCRPPGLGNLRQGLPAPVGPAIPSPSAATGIFQTGQPSERIPLLKTLQRLSFAARAQFSQPLGPCVVWLRWVSGRSPQLSTVLTPRQPRQPPGSSLLPAQAHRSQGLRSGSDVFLLENAFPTLHFTIWGVCVCVVSSSLLLEFS